MSVKQTSLDGFFSGGGKKRPNDDEKAETATDEKKEKKKVAFNRKYDNSYLKYGFIATGSSQAPSPMCIICGDKLANESMKPSKLLRHLETKHPALKNKPLEYFERKKLEQIGQLLKATTSTNVAALKASYLVADRIAKAKKPFTIGEELILPAARDICREMLGESAASKIGQIPLSATTVTRRIDDIADDIENNLLERINKSPWYALQVDESTDVEQ
ncbi:SCAN domain-containing protein 3-like [Paramisgurnus dabryanus]|uniref:SCAN domain-containing protein 3-like n=1 Tax=Paramisgurnus dabryanus TaxID=90735 RepID=UPI003CCF7B0E